MENKRNVPSITCLAQMGNGQDPHRSTVQVHPHFYPVHHKTIIDDSGQHSIDAILRVFYG